MKRLFAITILLLIQTVFSQAATIKGKAIDASTGEVLIGCSVQLREIKIGTNTGLDGSFYLKNVPVGVYTLEGRYLGYKLLTITVTINNANENISQALQFMSETTELNELTITGKQEKTSDRSARLSEKISDNIINTISAKTIELSPDLNVANVAQRISGVTIERSSTGDGQYAILRGMDKRFNYTMVNGVKIPSPDNKNRFVPLDLFPSELLDRLEVTKSLMANMEGDGIGGAVNMIMKDAPMNRQVTINLATGYNSLFFNNKYQSFDNSAINSKSPNERYGIAYPVKMKDFTTKNLHLNSGRAYPNLIGGFSFGDRFLKEKLGIMLAGSYQGSTRGNSSNIYSSSFNVDGTQLTTQRFFSNQQSRLGLHAKFDFKLSANHKLMWYNAFMDFRNAQVRDAISINSQTTRFRWNRQTIFNSTLKGLHSFFDSKVNLDWSLSSGKALNETPDNVQINAFVVNGITTIDQNDGASRRWEHNSDKDLTGNVNLQYSIKFGSGVVLDLTTGGLYRDKLRGSYYNEYHFKPNDPSKSNPGELIKGVDYFNFDQIKFIVNNYGNLSDPLNYNATEKIASGYLMEKLTLKKIQLIAGVRTEYTDQGYNLKFVTEGARNEGNQKYVDILPSINVKYLLNPNVNLRFSYSKGINRPSFFEIVPYSMIYEDYKERGNPDLKHTIADNFDLRYEYFPHPLEQFMVGIFYKNIKKPIEFGMMNGFGQDVFYMPMNFGNANNYGVELDFIKYFSWIGIKANYTFTNSDITTSKMKVIPNPDPNAETNFITLYVNQTRPLFGQAEHVANFSILFKDTQYGWDGQLAFAYTSDRLCIVSRYLNEDTWQAGFVSVDAAVEKRFQNSITLFAKASNLLNSPMIQYIKSNDNSASNTNIEIYHGWRVDRKEYYGLNISFGLRYKFH